MAHNPQTDPQIQLIPPKQTQFLQNLYQNHPKLAQNFSLILALTLICLNSLLMSLPLWLMGMIKTILGSDFADKTVIAIANHWIDCNNRLINILLPKQDWQIYLPKNLSPHKKYLLICNHQSWVDTSIVQYVSQDHLPLTRFFAKHELIYLPVVGQAFYFLDFPMMKRHSKSAIAKNPALKGRDLIEAKRACELLKNKPFTLLNYVEGTRLTSKKHQIQQSPYQHLLKPKAGGLALAISALGDEIDGILDMTIVYPNGIPSYLDLWRGKIDQLSVEIRPLSIPEDLFLAIKQGQYQSEDSVKQAMFAWLDHFWQEKDAQIDKRLKQSQGKPTQKPTQG